MANLTVTELGLVLAMGKMDVAALAGFDYNAFSAFILGGRGTGGHGTCQQDGDRYQYPQ